MKYLLIEAKQIEEDEAVKAWLAKDPRLRKNGGSLQENKKPSQPGKLDEADPLKIITRKLTCMIQKAPSSKELFVVYKLKKPN